jgi:hypothetical protein
MIVLGHNCFKVLLRFLKNALKICLYYTGVVFTGFNLGFFWLTTNWSNIYWALNLLTALSSLVNVVIPFLDGELIPIGGAAPVIQPPILGGAVPYNPGDLQSHPQSIPIPVAPGAIPFVREELLAPIPPQQGAAGAVPFLPGEIELAPQLPPAPFGPLPVNNNIGQGGLPQGPGPGAGG